MAIDAASYKRAAYPLAPRKGRFFALSWDNSKIKRADGDKLLKQETYGVKWHDGFISLNNGQVFESEGEMRTLLGLAGNYSVIWDGEE